MHVLVHDYSGHPFQVELSAELARRGHDVTHSWCEAHVSGKGNLGGHDHLRFESIGRGEVVEKLSFARRLVQEMRYGGQLARQIRRRKPDVVLFGNVPVPMMVVVTLFLFVTRTPWVSWQQDVQGIAMRSFAGTKLSHAFLVFAHVASWAERWCNRRADAIVVIAESFMDVHREWGTADKTTVIPNWAPLDELVPTPRDNAWAHEHDLVDVPNLVYSGTLGLKHNPRLLVQLTRAVRDRGTPAHLTVITEGSAVDELADEASKLDVPITLLPFQPYERLSEVLGSADALLVVLDKSAGAFSVPSKTLSYLCAARPILGLMPDENLAAHLIDAAGGCVLAPDRTSIPAAADWVTELLDDNDMWDKLGRRARELAEREFQLTLCASKFEEILVGVSR
ncbi:glycosyltransferase family 4 protein [Nocardioides bizhenqiangii]|uniref:Glycosyltransferase family 4 protein n=1 Tax=Nocardioides bizhenqiangii TaxID=3095076 RepID=A0ABZ0ZPG3_9ACTN|nr:MULTISPECIES: glycosyltransferase family 4 protein [unclassified Nocardioides]MDZ5620033.1 glycosyltransferase family 4 protein [Nocardioides sp. HM23]WQQ25965.1 glycosyltransferase family 4 protein [Nocardioides sp. HM61]